MFDTFDPSRLLPAILAQDTWVTRLFFRGPAKSTIARDADFLFEAIWWIGVFFFVLLMGLMFYCMVRYRRRAGEVGVRSASHNTMLELTWTVLPTLLLVWIFFQGFWGYADKVMAPANAQEVLITGQKWAWTATYPNGAASILSSRARTFDISGFESRIGQPGADKEIPQGIQDAPIFVVPYGRPTKFRMSSTDVIHSFWIPDFRIKFDVFPNRFTSLWIHPLENQKGDYWILCAEYCGDQHSEMLAILRVVSPEEYNATIRDWAVPKGSLVEQGAAYYRIKGCNACHTLDGSRNVGPTWKNAYGYDVRLADGTTVAYDANYIRKSTYDPASQIHEGYPNQMQTYQGRISENELSALIAFIQSLSERGPKPAAEGAPEGSADAPPG